MGIRTLFIHTGPVTMQPLLSLLPDYLPEVEVVHVTDTTLVRSDDDGMRASADKIASYTAFAESLNASAVFIACSAISGIADTVRPRTKLPIVRIDERMAAQAVSMGERIGLLATSSGTLKPSSRLIEQAAEAAAKRIQLDVRLCKDAFAAIARGDTEEHDRAVMAEAREMAKHNDVIVLAQASTARLQPRLSELGVPVLASPAIGLSHLREVLSNSGALSG